MKLFLIFIFVCLKFEETEDQNTADSTREGLGTNKKEFWIKKMIQMPSSLLGGALMRYGLYNTKGIRRKIKAQKVLLNKKKDTYK